MHVVVGGRSDPRGVSSLNHGFPVAPAGIDFGCWTEAKQTYGLYFVSRQNDNMNFTVKEYRGVERYDPRNGGVVSDQVVVPGSGEGKFRRVTYADASEGARYVYNTTEMTLPPG